MSHWEECFRKECLGVFILSNKILLNAYCMLGLLKSRKGSKDLIPSPKELLSVLKETKQSTYMCTEELSSTQQFLSSSPVAEVGYDQYGDNEPKCT